MTLGEALEETTRGWKKALPNAWKPVFSNVTLSPKTIPAARRNLRHDPWIPIFPVFRHRATGAVLQPHAIPRSKDSRANIVSVPEDAHTFRALLVPPQKVRVVVVGQDPYPDCANATGQSFEQGNLTGWVEDAHRVAGSLKPILQSAAAWAYDHDAYRVPWDGWSDLVDDLRREVVSLVPPNALFGRYQRDGVLLTNTTLTLSLFRVPPGRDSKGNQKKGYQTAHNEFWNPFVLRLFEYVVGRPGKSVVFALWGGWAKSYRKVIEKAADEAGSCDRIAFVEAGHPVTKPFLTRAKNPFTEINERLLQLGEDEVDWFPS